MLLFRGLLSPPASVGTAAGAGAVVGAGDSIFPSIGTASGTSAVSGVGAADLPSIGTAAGTSTMLGVGASDLPGTGISAGTGAANGVGAADSSAVGSAAGFAGGTGVGVQQPPYRVKIGTITGSGSASITDDPANLPQQFLNINFPTGGGGGSSIPNMKDTYGATGNGSTDDRAAFAALGSGGAVVPPGTYRIASNLTLNGHLYFMAGARLRPAAGVVISHGQGSSIMAGPYQIFDDSQGGSFANGANCQGWANVKWFPGTGSPMDLGVCINKGVTWGHRKFTLDNSDGNEFRTTVRVPHSFHLNAGANSYPQQINCKTSNKPVFEVTDLDIRHYRLEGGSWRGDTAQTPSCFLLHSSNSNGTQAGDTTAMSRMHIEGSFGVGVILHIGVEVCTYSDLLFGMSTKGDSPWAGPRACVIMGNADYWNVPFTYRQPNRQARSTSANVFSNCTIGYDGLDNSTSFLIKGQVEDTSINGVYLNSVGRGHFLFEPGTDINNNTTSPRRFALRGGGRFECNKGTPWAGCPMFIVDGGGLSHASMMDIGCFMGGAGGSVPVIQVINGGQLNDFTYKSVFIEGTDTLLDCRSSDPQWLDIRSNDLVTNINCTGRTIFNSQIKIAGQIFGTVNSSSRVQSANQNNW